MRLYIAGPMTGIPDFNFPAFNAAAATLRERGYGVINPAELDTETAEQHALNDKTVSGANLPDFLHRDFTELLTCTGIALLDGWHRSKGANAELMVARLTDLDVYRFTWSSLVTSAAMPNFLMLAAAAQEFGDAKYDRQLAAGFENAVMS